ncbi:ABC transporter permease [Streptomyces sp. URMC 123]|uniref:ABC transporter permease n=1 Tax=Streptomyces sp. URMC 123 TaxID=3423403 RepID=UPI003F19FC16
MSAATSAATSTTPPRDPRGAWRIVAGREMRVKIRDRSFLTSTLVTLMLVLGMIALQAYLLSSTSSVSLATDSTAPNGGKTVVQTAEKLADQSGQNVSFERTSYPNAAKVREAVKAGEADAGLVFDKGEWTLLGGTSKNDTAGTWIPAAVQLLTLNQNAQAQGTSVEELTKGANVAYELLDPKGAPEGMVRGSVFLFGFLFYLVSLLLGQALANAIVEEKQNRIVEIIAATIRLRDLLAGKIAGLTALAMAQMVVVCGVGAGALAAMGETDMLRQVTPGMGWFLLFFLFGVIVLAALYAAAGAVSTRPEDVQQSATPISMLMTGVFAAGVAISSGTSQAVLSFVPLTSTMMMPGRIIAGDASWWEPIVVLAISAAAAFLVLAFAERIYRKALMQTSRITFRKALSLTD